MKMSIRLPKRVKDLPPLEPDSEEELKTPAKTKSKQKDGGIVRFDILNRPKRVAELSPLTDSDDETRMNRFNHAILDDSLALSPLNSPETHHHMKHQVTTNENNRNYLNKPNTIKNEIPIELPDIEKLTLNDQSQADAPGDTKPLLETPLQSVVGKNRGNNSVLPRLSLFSQIRTRNSDPVSNTNDSAIPKKSSHLESIKYDCAALTRINSMPTEERPVLTPAVSRSKSEIIEPQVPNPITFNQVVSSVRKKSAEILIGNDQNANKIDEKGSDSLSSTETPFKTAVSNFVTPHFKSVQLNTNSKRLKSSAITSTQKKLKNINKNEFQSSKVLFRTPYAVPRPTPIAPLPNDGSISLSFNDDESIQSRTLLVNEEKPKEEKIDKKLSPIKENKNSKKLSRDLFGKEMMNNKIESILRSNEVEDDEDDDDDDDDSIYGSDTNRDVVVINGKEYIIYEKLGSGGSSSVHLARNKITRKMCAIKIVDLKGDQAIVEGYLNETRLLAKLQGNINIVALYEYEHVPAKSTLYMVMEKGDSDLHKILQTYKSDLPLYILTNFWYQILQAVNYIHENGVIHSDLKPPNFLMIKGRLKLIDFGIASNIAVDSTSIVKYSHAGTFNYISPEALIDTSTGDSPMHKGHPKIKISTKSDVWSLGCILYFLLYKKTPFSHIKNIYAKVNAITDCNTKIEYPELAPFYPKMLVEMAQKCLKHNPKERLSVAELLKYPFDMLIPLNRN